MESNVIQSTRKLFLQFKVLGEKAMEQVSEQDLFRQEHPETNSIAIIVKHLSGNMISRWTDFLTTDGEKPDRNRDAEFEQVDSTRKELMDCWEKGWSCLFAALDHLNENHLGQKIFIRNEPHTVSEAIYRQLTHYAYHVGQIVFSAKMYAQGDWISLSIPRKSSQHR